jgi:hypothetical protein
VVLQPLQVAHAEFLDGTHFLGSDLDSAVEAVRDDRRAPTSFEGRIGTPRQRRGHRDIPAVVASIPASIAMRQAWM